MYVKMQDHSGSFFCNHTLLLLIHSWRKGTDCFVEAVSNLKWFVYQHISNLKCTICGNSYLCSMKRKNIYVEFQCLLVVAIVVFHVQAQLSLPLSSSFDGFCRKLESPVITVESTAMTVASKKTMFAVPIPCAQRAFFVISLPPYGGTKCQKKILKYIPRKLLYTTAREHITPPTSLQMPVARSQLPLRSSLLPIAADKRRSPPFRARSAITFSVIRSPPKGGTNNDKKKIVS